MKYQNSCQLLIVASE